MHIVKLYQQRRQQKQPTLIQAETVNISRKPTYNPRYNSHVLAQPIYESRSLDIEIVYSKYDLNTESTIRAGKDLLINLTLISNSAYAVDTVVITNGYDLVEIKEEYGSMKAILSSRHNTKIMVANKQKEGTIQWLN